VLLYFKSVTSELQVWTVGNQRYAVCMEQATAGGFWHHCLYEAAGNICAAKFVVSTFKWPQNRPNRAVFIQDTSKLTGSGTAVQ